MVRYLTTQVYGLAQTAHMQIGNTFRPRAASSWLTLHLPNMVDASLLGCSCRLKLAEA